MSNFSDMAYDNYLMHYRTKGSKNGFTKDPDYTPVGEKARVEREKAARRNEINMRSAQARRGDYTGMPSSALVAKQRASEISRLSKQKTRGDYAGMPSSALKAKERTERASEINRLRTQFGRKGDTGGMPSSDYEAMSKATLEAFRRKRDEQEKRDEEISKITKNPFLRAYREDYSGMPTSAKDAALDAYRKTLEKRATRREKAKDYARSVEINQLSKQASKGDYAGMPSSVKEAQARVKEEKRDRMKANAEAKRKAEYMKADAEAKRKKEYDLKAKKDEINRLSEQASRGDLGGMPSSARSGNAYVKNRLAFKEWARKEREKDAREKARRNLQIDKLSRQKSKGDYAGMPSSARDTMESRRYKPTYEYEQLKENGLLERERLYEKDEKGQTSKSTAKKRR